MIIQDTIEEFNIGRERRFRGNIETSTLYLVHNLAAKDLEKTKTTLSKNLDFLKIELLDSSDLNKILDRSSLSSTVLLSLHLALDSEIETHQRISQWAFKHDFYQMNPYNKIAKIFDDKYLFYVLMKANEIAQPLTVLKQRSEYSPEKGLGISDSGSIVIKPRHGTENLDFKVFRADDNEAIEEHLQQVQQYDDVIVQEFIEAKKEYKFLYLQGNFYAQEEEINPVLKEFLYEFLDIMDNFARSSQLLMPEIFSLDILETNTGYIVLEANIRPAAIYSYTYKCS